ncbi:exonuclease domain-containing protein [Cyanobium sp. NS01]|uniref:exonuclease domain-containing protein n=1 Tax=unclassified Cyanobium TaxID=2627006 RepID=UPI00185FE934|nr:exonuclease domain-containing protein [Cyanobium sp. NS01]QNI70646.1 exonuclease family protein [Cyanobium sp. NS01]
MSGPPPEQDSLWQQQDLLGSLLAAPACAEPEPTPARGPEAELQLLPSAEPEPEPQLDRGPSGEQRAVPEFLLILDTETSGLDPREHVCLEVGAILFHVSGRAVLNQVSFLLPAHSNPAEAINGIAPAITRLPQPWRQGLACFEAMAAHADAALAHNARFDRQWFGRQELPELALPWICSMDDIRWPAERQLRPSPSVRDLALAYGVPVWAAHRALTDCIYLAEVFARCDDLEPLLEAALEPRQLFRAQLPYAERHQAKQAGFRWNNPVAGAWTRRLSAREAMALPFAVEPVAEGSAAA